jgi:23S rRNA (guanosine2251-2'-O)-methyltransferase
MKREVHLLLHDIRSAHNVGSIFRTADAAGVVKIHITGYTPAPMDAFNRPRKEIAKVALGGEKMVPWVKEEDAALCIDKLKKEGFQVIALEQAPNSIDYKNIPLEEKVLIIPGNEVEGVPQDILKLCDVVAEIPMRGGKESLNVSVSTGIALFRMLDL